MRDGIRLAARIWIPADAERSKVPAILEYIPYRKADRMRERDEPMHHYFAGHGYAAVRVDLRGTGDSEGLLLDEYHPQEIEDALDVIGWLRSQPWCTGTVGMMGKSWGGINALQVAARRPEGLAAVIAVCSSDDRFRDDAHYMGGCLLNENLVWGSTLLTLSALPPDPSVWPDRWRDMWKDRLLSAPHFTERWLRHPRRDEYWKHGSVSEDYEAIACPLFAVGGWADAYSNSIPRLLARLRVPRKGLIGPWAHLYPHNGSPGPAIGFLQEALAWWDQWLRGLDTGLMKEPMYRVWMPESHEPSTGRWVAEPMWPSENVVPRTYCLDLGSLGDEPSEDVSVSVQSPLTVGLSAGSWCSFGASDEMPLEQSEDDRRSLLFDSQPLAEKLEILGTPVLRLTLTCAGPLGMVAARLEDVSIDGASRRVTYGVLHLAHRESHEHPTPLVPGRNYQVSIPLNHVAHAFRQGHRLRLALSTAYWPILWPLPRTAAVELRLQPSRLEIPVRAPRPEDAVLRPFAPPETAPNAATVELHRGVMTSSTNHDSANGELTVRVSTDLDENGEPSLTRVVATGMDHGHGVVESLSIVEGDPLSARAEILHEVKFRRDALTLRVRSRTRLAADASNFYLESRLEGFDGDSSIGARELDAVIPRDLL